MTDLMWHRGAGLACDSHGDPGSVCRPFDTARSGLVYGEGAACLVLEGRDHAERRGVRPLARVAGDASRSESTAETQRPSGDAIRRAIRAALASAGLESFHVGHVNAHGNSTREDDPVEAHAIRDTLGEVPVTAPKSFFGNLGHGSGMVELAISLLALPQRVVPPTLNYETPDPECPVNVATELLPTEKPAFIALNHNTTGQAAAVVVTAI